MKKAGWLPVIVSDMEGPCLFNDNAFEILVVVLMLFGFTREAAETAYNNLSVIDDIWGDHHKVAHIDPNYSSGHTLKIVLAIVRALGVELEWLKTFSKESLLLVPNIVPTIGGLVAQGFELFGISTSYDFFVWEFFKLAGLDPKRAYCTIVDPDLYNGVSATMRQRNRVLKALTRISQMSPVEYDHKTGVVAAAHKKNYDYITRFVWRTLRNMEVGKLMREVLPVGQYQKFEAFRAIELLTGESLSNMMYVGDSQTDVQIAEYLFRYGLVVMFNGKGKVCERSNIMYIGQDARAIGELAEVFGEVGRDGIIAYCSPSRQARCGGEFFAVTPENVKRLEAMSVEMRKKLRGAAGSLT